MATKKSSRKWNWGLKLVSLLLALLLEWYFYGPENSITVILSGTIEIANLPPNTIIVEPPKADKGTPVKIKVRGPSSLVDQVKSGRHKLTVNAPSEGFSDFVAAVDLDQLNLPSGVDVLSVKPASFPVRTDKLAKKHLRVNVNSIGTPARGFRIDQIDVFPKTVVVRGPLNNVERMRSVDTQVVDLSEIKDSQKQEVLLDANDPLISYGVTMVTVDLQVSVIREQRGFDKIGVKVLAPAGFAATVQPSRAGVLLSGPISELEKLKPDAMVLVADGRTLQGGRHQVLLSGEFGQGVKIIRTRPEKVNVTLVKKDE